MPSTTQDLYYADHYPNFKREYNWIKQRWEWLIKYGSEWFVFNAFPSVRVEDDFMGVFDLSGFGIPCIVSESPFYVATTGAGTFTAIDMLRGGLRVTTAGAIGDDNTITAGDNAGSIYPWNVSQDIYFHAHFRFPFAADLTDVFLLTGLWADANNYICIRFDPTGAYYAANPNLLYVTRRGGSETTTSLGTPDNNWHKIWCVNSSGVAKIVIDGGATIAHTTNVPISNLTQYCFLETQAAAAKHFDFGHLIVLQDGD